MTKTAYPLTWPLGWKRTAPAERKRAQFGTSESVQSRFDPAKYYQRKRDMTVAEACSRVLGSLRRMGVGRDDVIVSTNVELRLDGLPYSNRRDPSDPGAAVYWRLRGRDQVMAVDLYDSVADNLAAVAATLEALRAIERHGGAAILDRAFTGFTALPSPENATAPGWREILGFPTSSTPTTSEVELAYRRRRSEAHPDRNGGDAYQFNLIQRAVELARQELA